MKKVLKIVGIILLIIVVMIAGFAIYINARGIPSYEAKDPGVTVHSDSSMEANGRRLSDMLCKNCHYNEATGKLRPRNFRPRHCTIWRSLFTKHHARQRLWHWKLD